MVSRLFFSWAIVELAVLIALASTIGVRWTLLTLLATFLIGVVLAGSQVKRQLRRLRSGLIAARAGATPRLRGTATDGALAALGTVLLVVPGLVTSVVGLLLLAPPTRAVARPLLVAMAARGLGRPLVTAVAVGEYAHRRARARGEVIDGEVIDVTDVEPPALPPRSG